MHQLLVFVHPFRHNRSNDDGNFTLATVDAYSAANSEHSVQVMWDLCVVNASLVRVFFTPLVDCDKCEVEGLTQSENTFGCITHNTVLLGRELGQALIN